MYCLHAENTGKHRHPVQRKAHRCVFDELTLASDNLDAHAGVAVPVDGVELDEARHDRLVQVGVLHRVRVDVALEQLPIETSPCVKIIRIIFGAKS